MLVTGAASGIGLETALRGRQVLVAGAAHYARRGFTRDIVDRESYEAELQRALRDGPLCEERVELARRYTYMLVFRLMHPFPWVVDQPRGARALRLESLAELGPGRDATLDRICAAILEGAPLVEAE